MKNKITKVYPPKFSEGKLRRVKKRNSEIVDFDQAKITDAIFKAITATGQGDGKKSKRLSDRVVKILNRRFKKEEIPQVEQIQDIVEEVLILEGLVETARAYILYREQRRRIREATAVVDESSERIDSYLQDVDWQVRENANMTFSLQGLNQYVGSYISKKYWLNKIYPPEIREAARNEDFHIHNLEILATYTFFGREVVVAKLNNQIKLIPFDELYKETHQKESLLNERDDAWARYPEDLYVLDKNGWTKVLRIVRKKKERQMSFIKSEQGRSIIVTDNHPFIIKRGEKEIDVETKTVKEKEDFIFSASTPALLKTENLFSRKYIYLAEELLNKNEQDFFLEGFYWQDFIKNWGGSLKVEGTLSTSNSANSLDNRLELTEDLGYLVGIFIAEGNYHSWRLMISNSDEKIIEKIQKICAELGLRSYLNKDINKLSINCSTIKLIFDKVFQIKEFSKNKNLPFDILTYNLDFVRGVIAGVIDGDGSVRLENKADSNSQVLIRVSSRTLIEQLSILLQFFGIIARDRVSTEDIGKINIFQGHEIIQNYPIYGIVFSKKEGVNFPSFKYQNAVAAKKHWRVEDYGWARVLNNKSTAIADDVIFDITTASGTFLCNSLLVHNCAGWDLYDLLKRGFGGVTSKLECRPAKHFRTALGQLVNFLYTLQGETAGANAVSNFDTLLAPFIRYDGLSYSQVKQAIQEFLYNCMVPTRVGFQSLCWDELVVIKDKGKIIFEEIGKLIDKEFKRNSHRIIEKHPQSYAIENHDDYYVLSFDQKGKAVWARVKAFIRHKVPKNSEFVKIKTNRGEVKVSEAHSLFSFLKFDGTFNPQPRSAENIKIAKNYRYLNPENHFIGLKSLENQGDKRELDLVEIIDEIPQLHKNVFVKINPARTLEGIRQNILLEKQSFIPFYKEFGLKDRGVWEDWLNRKSIRYEIWRKYGNLKQGIEFKLKNSDIWYPRILEGKSLENFVKLCAWYITEGHSAISTPLYISQSPSKESKEIIGVLKELSALGQIAKNKSYSKKPEISGEVFKITGKGLLAELISRSCGYLAFNKVIPSFIFELSSEYQEIFLETLLKGDASEYKDHWDFSTSSKKLSSSLSFLLAQNNHRFSIYLENTSKKNKNWRDKLINRIYKVDSNPEKIYFVNDFEAKPCLKVEKFRYQKEYEYDISVDSPQENFIGGNGLLVFHNTPFLNVTLDIKPPEFLAKQPVIIGGELKKETYSELQAEMDMFNQAFYEGLMEGDAKGRPFTFPIPTVSITKDFDWENPALNPLWEATAKYGVNYFQNFVQSDMKPEDFRSMCLDPNEEIIIRNSKKIKRLPIKKIIEKYKSEDFDKEGWTNCKKEGNLEVLSLNPNTFKTEWSPVKRFFRVFDRKAIEISTEDGKTATFSTKHPIPVFTEKGIIMKWSEDIKKGDYLLSIKNAQSSLSKTYQQIEDIVLDEDVAKILGYFIADGNYLFENRKGYTYFDEPKGLQFTFKTGDKDNLENIKYLIKKVFSLDTKERQDPRYNTYYLYVYNSVLARKLYNAGFKKYGRLPQIIFNSPAEVIKSFLEFHFKGDGYEKRKEIHLNDLELSRDLVLLYSLIGQPITYKIKKRSQRIYIQHAKSKIKKGNGWSNNPIISERIPAFIINGRKIPGFSKSRTIGFDTIEKYNAQTNQSSKLKNGEICIVRAKSVKKKLFRQLREFFDLELEKNHLFLHSLGQISFNCCRLRLNNKELYMRGGGLFGSQPLTGSCGVVTINMPRIGYLSKTKKEFFERLGHLMDLAKESLEIKRKALDNFIEKGLYPYSKYYLASVKKMRNSYFGNHFSTIGLIGMNEALLNFLEEDIGSKRGRIFALEVLDFMRERLIKYQEETGHLFNLEATPGEGTSYRQAKADKERYPDIITAGTKQVPYYTNSTMLPVNYTDDIFGALKLQDEIQCKYTGGVVMHLFLGERISDVQTTKSLVKKIFENFKLPYITLTPTFSICQSHGYLPGEHFYCPKCTIKQPCEVYSRIVGYLRPVQQWHVGKKQEFQERKEFKLRQEAG